MNHYLDIEKLVGLLLHSEKMHLLVIHGRPGWGKSQSVFGALKSLGIEPVEIGSHVTPLGLFKKFAEYSTGVIVADDSGGILSNPTMLSLICSASWPSGDSGGARTVRWTSTSEAVPTGMINFTGKIIVLTNFVPNSAQSRALMNRAIYYKVEVKPNEISSKLLEAANSNERFSESALAKSVAEFLSDNLSRLEADKMSLRTLEQGYEIAKIDKAGWKELFSKLLPWKANERGTPEDLLQELVTSNLTVGQQIAEFCRQTGKSRRTFFYLKDRLGTKGA